MNSFVISITDYESENQLYNPLTFIFVIILIVIILYQFKTPCKRILIETQKQEHMSPGTLTQMYAQDAQDTYLKGNVDQIATGNFVLQWGQPTRIASGPAFFSTDPNRGWNSKTDKDCKVNGKETCKKKNGCICSNGIGYYPRAYPGNFYQPPEPDINYPLPYIVNAASFQKEGYENTDK